MARVIDTNFVPFVNEGGGGRSCGRLCLGHLVTLFRLVALEISAAPPLDVEAWTSTVADASVGNFQLVSFILDNFLLFPSFLQLKYTTSLEAQLCTLFAY